MTRAQILLALSTIASSAAIVPASDCDCSKPSKGTSCACARDDSGLLDVVDEVAGRFHAGFRTSLTKISRLQSKMKQPNCGCEVQPTDCDCQACRSDGNSSFTESNSAPPMALPGHSIVPHGDVPPSLKVPHPVPDSQLDPFIDEPARSGQSRVRGKTIQYRSNNGTNQPNTNRPNNNRPNTNQPNNSQPKAKPGSTPRVAYGQQYSSQARRMPSTAEYWAAGSSQPSGLQLVAPASSNAPTLEEVFRPAYRVSLRDTDELPSKPQTTRSNTLRPVPNQSIELRDSRESNTDLYERKVELTPIYDNPLRR